MTMPSVLGNPDAAPLTQGQQQSSTDNNAAQGNPAGLPVLPERFGAPRPAGGGTTTSTSTVAPTPTATLTVVSTTFNPDGTITEVMSDGSVRTAQGPDNTYAQTGQSAQQTIDAWANSVGLGALSSWINQQVQLYAGQGMSAADIANMISSTINKAPGFDQILPGYNQRIKNGYTNSGDTGTGIAGYMAYVQQIQAMAETAGLVPGTITAQDIGNSWANDVSTAELSDRITTEYVNAVNAAPAIQAELQNYGYTQGLSHGQLASYYLNPDNTINQLQQQFNSAVVGGEGKLTGFGEIGQAQASALQAFLSNSGQQNLSAAQAANFFTGSPGNGLASLAQMSNTGFTQAELGTAQNGPGVVTQSQLIGAGEGNAQALQDVQRAAQTRSAASKGGGGFAANQQGVSGAGFGNQ